MDRASGSQTPPADARAPVDGPAASGGSLKRSLVNFIPVATLVAVVLGWMLAPRSITESPWSILIAGVVTSFFLLGLEQLFERHEGWRLNKIEFATDLFYMVLMYTVIGWAVEVLADGPLASLKEMLGITTPWVTALPFVLQVALVIFLIEFGQYWMHRAMHNWYPLWLTHAPHHHITQLNALKGFVGNPIELFLISLSVVALFDFDIVALFCALNVLGVISGYAHANIRSDPPLVYSFVFTTIRHHSLHHTALSYEDTRCNYANSLILIDRIFGTYREGESAIVGQDERKRLSIYEQFMFPFQPLIDKYKSRRSTSA
ncbi:sterol desaturase family protein [Alteraurantiacibacter aquimixticola]|uniref:Fatty acid hydroxylase family protein n=1 Tax=Alteraurantiacibacter aquimixticola TaxID=2489173 RepID=A0A4T3EZ60_9SPHN|nr:sterol desaturase family protein [Alteraurantiacibacter aquimixticola]TIX49831.1 fatty acid hydroxylase family protein [Alteraurantiacibacter aquimixticola]